MAVSPDHGQREVPENYALIEPADVATADGAMRLNDVAVREQENYPSREDTLPGGVDVFLPTCESPCRCVVAPIPTVGSLAADVAQRALPR